MSNKIIATAAIFLFFSPINPSNAEQVITLKDGSRIKGELVGVKDGSYTIKSSLMGDVTVSGDQVANIANSQEALSSPTLPASPAAPNANGALDGQIQAAQNKLMTDPQMMGDIQTLVQDPEIAQLLTDPALMQAVMARDPAALQNNPRAQALMANPKMRALMDRLRQQQ